MKKGFVKIVKAKIPWVSHVIDDEKIASDLYSLRLQIPQRSMCVECRGSKLLCGKRTCPVLVRAYSFAKIKPFLKKEICGSSPPSVFIGRVGYPYVYAGPLVPPVVGDTSLYDMPELWLDKTFEDIINFRFKLIRGKFLVNVKRPQSTRFMEYTKELAMSKGPAEAELVLKREPTYNLVLDSEVQPIGPSGLVESININNVKTDQNIQKAYDDIDLKASEAIMMLYNKGVIFSKIEKAFSMGLFGLKKQRRLVPTRWSITAVDSIISNSNIDEIKDNPWLNEYRVYEYNHLDRKFLVLLIPDAWSYELIEVWYPNTMWNPNSDYIAICSDNEGYWGRTTYASIGGCYYSARLAVSEFLRAEKRQASAIVISEAYPGHMMPIGVWEVRESIREALKRMPERFDNLNQAMTYLSTRLKTKVDKIIANSNVLKNIFRQEKLTKFLK
ncbi:MAG: Nre family DNA repair protein [Candidatus Aenigmatarchaeota archaeon]